MTDHDEDSDVRWFPPELIAAKVEHEKAEADKLREETLASRQQRRGAQRRAAAEARKFEAEATKALAEATIANHKAAVERIHRDEAERKERTELARDKYHHVYDFDDPVSWTSVNYCREQLTEWMRNDPGCDIEIVFSSPGGEVMSGLSLFDFIQEARRREHKVTTVAMGWAASMAGILLQAGDVRVTGREAYILIHEISSGSFGKTSEMEDEVKFLKKIQGRVLDIFASRSKKPRRYFEQHWKRKDWWLDSAEALELGIVDEIREYSFPGQKPVDKKRKKAKP